MTTNNYLFNPEERLDKNNFEDWYPTVSSILESKELLDFILKDVISTTTDEVMAGTKTQQDLEATKVKDSKARAFILTSITKEVKRKIRNTKTAYDIMTKIKDHYDKTKSKDVDHYIKRLNSLKSKNIDDSLEIMSEITDFFEILDEKNYKLGTLEKAKHIYFAVPTEIRMRLQLKPDMDFDNFVEDARSQINVLQYFLGKTVEKETKTKKVDDFMDIDYVEKPKHSNIKRENNYCYICEMKGHTTDKCGFNHHVREERKKTNLNRRRKLNKKENKRKYIGNVELDEDCISDNDNKDNTCFDEIQPLFEKQVNNIELLLHNKEEIDNSNRNHINDEVLWTYDTGCSEHITCDKNILKNFRKQKLQMKCANNTICEFQGIGTFEGKINDEYIRLDNVYYSNKINKNLLSGNKLPRNGFYIDIKAINNKTILTLKKVDKHNNYNPKTIGIYTADETNIVRIPIKQTDPTINNLTNRSNNNNKLDEYSKGLWHRRLGHFHHDNLDEYLELHNIKKNDCLVCKIAKLKRLPHNGTPPSATRILETIHSDLIGPINIISSTGKRFVLTFVDEFSRKSWIYLLEKKKEATKTTIQFLKYITTRYNFNIKFFKTDNGLEFKNRNIENYYSRNGITKLYSPPYNPQNNGKAERFNQTLINCAKTMLTWSKLDQKFWDYTINYANHLYNINPHKGIGNAIPNEVFFNKKIDLKYIRTFGCITYYKVFDQDKGKFEANSKKGVFLGFNFRTHCYIIMDYKNLKIHLVREAIFDEDQPANLTLNVNEFTDNLNSFPIKLFLMIQTIMWKINYLRLLINQIKATII